MAAEFLPDNPYDMLSEGCDFARNHMSDCIDFATIHLWPDTWLAGAGQGSEEGALRFARRWINAHVDCCARLGKPLVLTEFGKKPAGAPRAAFYQKVCTFQNAGVPPAPAAPRLQHELLMSAAIKAVPPVQPPKGVQPSQPRHLPHIRRSAHIPYTGQTRTAGPSALPVHEVRGKRTGLPSTGVRHCLWQCPVRKASGRDPAVDGGGWQLSRL